MKKQISSLIVIGSLIASGLVFIGCNYKHEKLGGSADTQTAEVDKLDFASMQSAVFQPKCVACHNSATKGGGVSLEDYPNVKASLQRIYARAVEAKTMPPNAELAAGELAKLTIWIQDGAPEQATAPKAMPVEMTNWQQVESGFFVRHCTVCHAPPAPDASLDLTSLSEVRSKASLIFSHVGVLRDMPLAPFASPSDDERRSLADWIISGMPE